MTDTNQEVRETWVMVPREPTWEMLDAAWKATKNASPERRMEVTLMAPEPAHAEKMKDRWAAMLASAPPPAVPDAVGVRERTMVDALDTIANGRVGESFTPAADVIALLMKVAQDALSSIEPTPSPEPQASNAGAELNPSVTMLREAITNIDAFGNEPSDRATVILERKDSSTFEMIGVGNEPLRLADLRKIAALTTPEPQTGERDGEIKAWLLGDPATGQWIEVDGQRVAYSRGMGRPAHVLAEAFKVERARADTAEGNANRWKARAEAAERRLAEVEERAKEDERDRLLNATDHVNTPPYRVALRLFLREHGAMEPADRAALRAKPEAQAIGGKEGDQ